jgi:hypothetical protein
LNGSSAWCCHRSFVLEGGTKQLSKNFNRIYSYLFMYINWHFPLRLLESVCGSTRTRATAETNVTVTMTHMTTAKNCIWVGAMLVASDHCFQEVVVASSVDRFKVPACPPCLCFIVGLSYQVLESGQGLGWFYLASNPKTKLASTFTTGSNSNKDEWNGFEVPSVFRSTVVSYDSVRGMPTYCWLIEHNRYRKVTKAYLCYHSICNSKIS